MIFPFGKANITNRTGPKPTPLEAWKILGFASPGKNRDKSRYPIAETTN
ncbi:MAG: hypothetical protein ACKOAH_00390 [Pirellula sp.]